MEKAAGDSSRRKEYMDKGNEKLITNACTNWHKKYRNTMRKYISDKICESIETDSLFYKKKNGICEIDNGIIHALKAIPKGAESKMYNKMYFKTSGTRYTVWYSHVFFLANTYFSQTITEFLPDVQDYISQCWKYYRKHYINKKVVDWLMPNVDSVLTSLEKNKVGEKNMELFKRRQVLDHIPDDMTELFPNARSIDRHFILHVGDTNTGKTFEAMQSLASAPTGAYFAPLRLLALEGQEKLLDAGVNCSMRTGEEEDIRPDSTHISCTMEMLDPDRYFDVVVIDEAQMISDEDRGYAWTNGILGCFCPKIHVCMSENALNLIIKMIESCGDTYEVKRHERNTKLIFEDRSFSFPKDVQENDALVVFSRRDVLAAAAELESAGWKPSVIYGSLPYSARKEEMRRFADHETNVVVATDAIGMGINMPIHRVVFLKNEKYDGKKVRYLTPPEVKQIAGRAGRRGIFNEGYVNAAAGSRMLRRYLSLRYEDLTSARIQIPDTLFELPMKLSEILTEWGNAEDNGIYQKVSLEYRIAMCKWLEQEHPDFSKNAMWKFLCIAYDEKNDTLRYEWQSIIAKIDNGILIDDGFEFRNMSTMNLSDYEQYYKHLDLYFSFARTYGEMYRDFRASLMEEKERVATKIMEKLKQSKRGNRKQCRQCGRVLPFSSPYTICDSCHNQQYSYYNEWW